MTPKLYIDTRCPLLRLQAELKKQQKLRSMPVVFSTEVGCSVEPADIWPMCIRMSAVWLSLA